MKQKFIDKNFSKASIDVIAWAIVIIEEYEKQRMRLSLRQLYYQMVARGLIENTVQSYKRIGNIISDARDAGHIDWDAIEDRGRDAVLPTEWENPAEIVRAAANGFRVDRWKGQADVVEVMVEKDALSGVLSPICRNLHVRFSANKGYTSASMAYEAGQRIWNAIVGQDKKHYHILYFGDHRSFWFGYDPRCGSPPRSILKSRQ